MKSVHEAIALCLILASVAGASTIEFKGVPTGVNDGRYYVTPYEVEIDGVVQLVTCYDIYDDVDFGDVWQANILTLGQVAASGFFSDQPNAFDRYARIGWLDSQTFSDSNQQIGLQYAIWNVFGTAPSTPDSLIFQTAADQAAASGYAGFDLDRLRFIEQVGGVSSQPGTKQAFVFVLPDSGPANLVSTVSTAEPSTVVLVCTGLLILGFSRVAARSRAIIRR